MITDEMVERATEVWYSLPLQTRDADRFRRTIEAAIGDMVLVPRESAKMVSHVCAEWIDLFRDAPGIDKCERFSYEPAVEELRDEYAAIAAHSDTGAKHGLGTYPEDWKRLDAALDAPCRRRRRSDPDHQTRNAA